MKVRMIYHTPEIHKLVEAVARVCYQSYHKVSPDSHTMVRSIMKKGHLSVSSVGNMVFSITFDGREVLPEEWIELAGTLMTFKEINNYVRWTISPRKGENHDRILISMNMLSLMDILNEFHNYDSDRTLLDLIIEEVKKVPYLHWFLNSSVEVPPSDNPYIKFPSLGRPVILSQDYTALKELGLSDYELDIHATVTVDFLTDRASGLQSWRHADMAGGCELSQRYVDRSSSGFRPMVGIYEYPEGLKDYAEREGLTMEEAKEHYDAVIQTLHNHNMETMSLYSDVMDTLEELGVSKKRAKEIARSILPNAITTRIIQCRPLRQWKHFFDLRATVHAQPEIREDARSMMREFEKEGVVIGRD